jgi:hypothetical protein
MAYSKIDQINATLDSINGSAKEISESQKKIEQKIESSLEESKKQTLILERQEAQRLLEKREKEQEIKIRNVIFEINEEFDSHINSSSFYNKAFSAYRLNSMLERNNISTDLVQNFDEKKYISECIKKIKSSIQENKQSKNQSHIFFLELIEFDYNNFVSNIKIKKTEISSDEKDPSFFNKELTGQLDIFNKKYESVELSSSISKKKLINSLREIYDPLKSKSDSYSSITKKNHKIDMPDTYTGYLWPLTILSISIFSSIAVSNKSILFFIGLLIVFMIWFIISSHNENIKLLKSVRNKTFKQIVNKAINDRIDTLSTNYNKMVKENNKEKEENNKIIEKANLKINEMNDKIEFVSKDCENILSYFPEKFQIVSPVK